LMMSYIVKENTIAEINNRRKTKYFRNCQARGRYW
jgi:hypothetical protein